MKRTTANDMILKYKVEGVHPVREVYQCDMDGVPMFISKEWWDNRVNEEEVRFITPSTCDNYFDTEAEATAYREKRIEKIKSCKPLLEDALDYWLCHYEEECDIELDDFLPENLSKNFKDVSKNYQLQQEMRRMLEYTAYVSKGYLPVCQTEFIRLSDISSFSQILDKDKQPVGVLLQMQDGRKVDIKENKLAARTALSIFFGKTREIYDLKD